MAGNVLINSSGGVVYHTRDVLLVQLQSLGKGVETRTSHCNYSVVKEAPTSTCDKVATKQLEPIIRPSCGGRETISISPWGQHKTTGYSTRNRYYSNNELHVATKSLFFFLCGEHGRICYGVYVIVNNTCMHWY